MTAPFGRSYAALSAAPEGAAVSAEASTDPLDLVDAAVRDAVTGALGVPAAPPDANFLALGGDSLAALEVIATVQDALGCELPLELLFEYPVLGDFADQVRAVLAAAP